MPLKINDRIAGSSRGSVAQYVAHLDGPDDKDRAFVESLWRWCGVAGIDFAGAVSWVDVETDALRSPRWNNDLNPGGISVTSDSTIQPFTIPDADAAARIFVQCVSSAVTGQRHPGIPLWDSIDDWFSRVWLRKVTAANYPRPARWTDLDVRYPNPQTGPEAVWAFGHQLGQPAEEMARRANAIFPTLPNQGTTPQPQPEPTPMPDTITFGNVKHPPFVDKLIPDAENFAWDNLGQCVPVGVCQHSMVGGLWGTDGWFRRGRLSTGLTHYGVGNSTDGPQWDGVILRWNDPTGKAHGTGAKRVSANRSGWANGGSDGLEGDGPLFVRTFGVAGINRNLVSIERSDGGDITTPMSPKQFESICQLTAYWFDFAKVPWDRYPLNPAYDIVTHLIHLEFATKTCPHPPVTGQIDRIQDRVRQILKAAQTRQPAPNPVPPPNPPNPPHNDWAPYTLGQVSARWADLRRFTFRPGEPVVEEVFGFDPKGLLSNSWFARIKDEGIPLDQAPVPDDWLRWSTEFTPGLQTVSYGNGVWIQQTLGTNEGWKWLK